MPDVTIIGAGPAGSVAAILLARANWSVTLVEQSRFPRDKVCGECLSAVGVGVLTRLGLLDALAAHGPVRLLRTMLHAQSGASVTAPLPRPMLGVSRAVLDGFLLDAARASGATVRQPARCERIEVRERIENDDAIGRASRDSSARNVSGSGSGDSRDGSRGATPRVTLRDLVTNAVTTSPASFAIVAEGKAGPSASADDAPRPTGDFGIKAHFASVDGPRDAIELFGTADRYGGLAPIEAGRWNAAFSVGRDRLRAFKGNVEALFDAITSENPVLASRLARAQRLGPWLASPLPRFAVRKSWPARVIPVGNAAAALEPIGGEGMGLAMRSAELAAEALIASGGSWDAGTARTLAQEYDSLWCVRRAACRAAAVSMSSPRFAAAIMPLLNAAPACVTGAMRLMGKSGERLARTAGVLDSGGRDERQDAKTPR
jgi:2-polyprenyl-6-methoxyphenol hydroxylase-like FAD-dependent oxidoreductase